MQLPKCIAVVTAKEMAQLEKVAYDQGSSEEEFMQNAGRGIADHLLALQDEWKVKKKLYLLIGKGNNGGDAFVAGRLLREKGWDVEAITLFDKSECSALSQKQWDSFSGEVRSFSPDLALQEGIILDGLVGTGFHGKAEGILLQAIELINKSACSVVAIDIPSGLEGDTGLVQSSAVSADVTIYLGFPKLGFYLNQGWNHVGKLLSVDFGLPSQVVEKARSHLFALDLRGIAPFLPAIERTQHKYSAGYVLAVAGSPGMGGAALLACKAALRSGAGIVRLFHLEGMEEELSSLWELVKQKLDPKDPSPVFAQQDRAKAILVGPGLGRTPDTIDLVGQFVVEATLPVVYDADALFAIGENSGWDFETSAVLTPHRGELAKLLNVSFEDDQHMLEESQKYVQSKQVTLVIKGAPTFIVHPSEDPIVIAGGDPGMATAGSGDVLSGIIAALISRGLSNQLASVVGVGIHCFAGELAAKEKGSYSLIARDLIEKLPEVFVELSKAREETTQ